MPQGIYKHKPLSEETKKKLSILRKGKPFSGIPRWIINPNWKHSEESKQKMREAKLRSGFRPPLTLKGAIPWNKGKKFPEFSGENHPNWRGGKSPEYIKIKTSPEYREWRRTVFKRDNYTCQFCTKRGIILNADHIKPFSLFPELRFEISNGRTLCVPCHKKTDTYGFGFVARNMRAESRNIEPIV